MSAPLLVITFGLERAPNVYIVAQTDAELVRLCDWIDAHPEWLPPIAQLFALTEQEQTT